MINVTEEERLILSDLLRLEAVKIARRGARLFLSQSFNGEMGDIDILGFNVDEAKKLFDLYRKVK